MFIYNEEIIYANSLKVMKYSIMQLTDHNQFIFSHTKTFQLVEECFYLVSMFLEGIIDLTFGGTGIDCNNIRYIIYSIPMKQYVMSLVKRQIAIYLITL